MQVPSDPSSSREPLPTWDVIHSPTHTHFLAPPRASIMLGADYRLSEVKWGRVINASHEVVVAA